MFLATSLMFLSMPAFAAEPAGEAGWKKWVDEQNAEVRDPLKSFLNLNDAAYVKKGDKAFLDAGANPSAMTWVYKAPAKTFAEVTFDGKQALLVSENTQPFDLLQAKDKTWKAPNGLFLEAQLSKDGDLRVLLRNPDHPKLKAFHGLRFFPYSPETIVRAKLVREEPYRDIQLPTVLNRTKAAWIPGHLEFELGGKPQRLEVYAFEPIDQVKELFVPFKDATNGKESYAAGRYIDVAVDGKLESVKELTIDFNRAYNPNCARSRFYNCIRVTGAPLPVAVRAGEMAPLEKIH